MKPRNLLIVAVAMGVLAVALLQAESWRSRGGTVYVFKATRDVEPPDTLRGALEVVGIPRTSYDAMASQVPTTELEGWVSSTPVVRRLRPGETVTFDALQKAADAGLQIAAGMRAVGLEVSAGARAVGFLVRPGDHVDVISTVPETQMSITRHVLQAKRVLAVDQQYRLEDTAFLQNRTYSTVTLEVTPAEAEMLEAYRRVARDGFSLALRPRGDLDPVRTPGFPISELGAR